MSGFADLAEKAQPTLGRYPAKATAGTTWEFVAAGPDFHDHDDVPIDFRGTTGVCVLVEDDGTKVADFQYVPRVGEVLLFMNESVTKNLAEGAERACRWSLSISDGADVVQVWSRAESPFYILQN